MNASPTERALTRVWCDRCGEMHPRPLTMANLPSGAPAFRLPDGWRRGEDKHGDLIDLCPECRAKGE